MFEAATRLWEDGDVHGAALLLGRVLELAPNSIEARIAAAHAFTKTGEHDAAIQHAEHAVRLRSDYADAKDALFLACAGKAAMFYEEKNWTGVFDYLQKAVVAYPEHEEAPESLKSMWFCAEAANRTEELVSTCRVVLSSHPDWNDVRYRMGRALLKLRRFDEAVTLLREYSRRDECNTDGHLWLGLACLAAGRREEAFEEYEILKESSPEEAAKVSLVFKTPSVISPAASQSSRSPLLERFFELN